MRANLAQAREAIRRCRGIRDSGKVEAVLRGGVPVAIAPDLSGPRR